VACSLYTWKKLQKYNAGVLTAWTILVEVSPLTPVLEIGANVSIDLLKTCNPSFATKPGRLAFDRYCLLPLQITGPVSSGKCGKIIELDVDGLPAQSQYT
jgi:hypothetical protein